ncbi:hypothetical protein [Clostridium sp. KNHs214]|uniref:hypothetical protein n=1 Tax=Clostridium sp. KNHs214 TaxID=1540257 RepID=UPI00055680E4|nr:hypothetical protein [Clostridium sp. KNHs214]
MGNIVQKFIYNVSTVAPLSFIFALVWYLQKETLKVPLISIAVGIVLIVLFSVSFSYGKTHIAPIIIRTNDISPYDGWVVLYVLSYALPFASMAIKDFDVTICAILGVILAVVAPYVNTSIPNPLLWVKQYHFYQVSGEHGMSGYTVISKRKLRRSKDLGTVNRIFDFLLLDTGR